MKIQFKDLDLKIKVVGFGEVTPQNINDDLYQKLIEINPAFSELFEFVEESDEE